MRLAESSWLMLVVLGLLPWFWGLRRARLSWPTLEGFTGRGSRTPAIWRSLPWLTRGGAIVCLAVAIARPQVPGGRIKVAGRGVAIIALIDRSSSMKAVDFPAEGGLISRLDGARATLSRFVERRDDDLVGLIKFANYPDVDAAPTLDQGFLLDAIRAIRPAGQVDDGTNLGDAIAQGLGLIREAPTRKKVLILLTDGRNAPAVPKPVDPIAAATLARELGVTLHTIAIGRPTEPGAPDSANEGPDLALLARLAELGGGQPFVATDAGALDQVFERIDELEKSPVAGTVRTLYREEYAPWASAALILLAIDLILSAGRFRRLP
jgi:Ca-activated chloride channel family protein